MKTMVVFKTRCNVSFITMAVLPCHEKPERKSSCSVYWKTIAGSTLDNISSMLREAHGWRKATEQEAAPIKAEMETKGYNLEVWRRMPTKSERERWIEKGNE